MKRVRSQCHGVLIVLALTALGVSCRERRTLPRVPEATAVLAAFEAPAGDLNLANGYSANQQPRLQLYLDASGSMRGFLTAPKSKFRRVMDQVLDRAVSGGYDLSVFRFDSAVTALPPSTSTFALQSDEFFRSGETSFPTLFREIRRRREPGTIAMVITDLVQSSGTGEQRELSRAFQELAQDRPEVLLFALRSAFVGRYWPEATPAGDHLDLNLGGNDLRSSRPFYLLVLADSVDELDVLRRRLGLTVQPGSMDWELDASRPAMVVEEAAFSPRAQGSDASIWQVAKRQEVIPPLGRTYRDVLWLLERAPPARDAATVRLKYRIEGEKAITDLGRVAAVAYRLEIGPNGISATPEPIQVRAAMVRPVAAGDLIVSYSFPRPAAGSWEAYQVRLLPGTANLERPFNLDLWTTDDDSLMINQTRTYKLDLFADTLTNALREPVAIAEHFIVLGRSD